jgi:hypothetical protein
MLATVIQAFATKCVSNNAVIWQKFWWDKRKAQMNACVMTALAYSLINNAFIKKKK